MLKENDWKHTGSHVIALNLNINLCIKKITINTKDVWIDIYLLQTAKNVSINQER